MENSVLQKLGAIDLECTEITSVIEETNYKAGKDIVLPPFIRIKLVSKPSKTSLIYHELWLPKEWNGVFFGTGNGGIGGAIAYNGLELGVWRHCAAINTDMGTSDGRIRGINDPEVWKDYGWRATYLMTKLGKQITEAFYGEKIKHSYFYGASTGGQQSLMLAQRYPKEYEGIIAGVPGNYRTHLHTFFLWTWNKVRGKDGNLLFKAEDFPLIMEKAYEFCAEKGVIPKGQKYIPNPDFTKEFIREFVEYLGVTLSFNEEQKNALYDIYVGPYDPKTGEQIYCGLPMGSECKGNTAMPRMLESESPYIFPFVWAFGKDYNGRDFDFSDDMKTIDNILAEDLNANSDHLEEFFSNGGKLFMYSGSADPTVPCQGGMNYFAKVSIRCGPKKTFENMRYFLIPGQAHGANVCGYGKSKMNGSIEVVNNLDIIRKWCEEGIAPDYFDVKTPNGEEIVTERIFAFE